jgi:hypothetical protein
VAVSTLVKQDDRLALEALLTAALAGRDGAPRRPSCSSPATRTCPVSILAWGVREHDGEILSVLIQVDDLRERRRAEAARERLAEERAGRARAEAGLRARAHDRLHPAARPACPRRLPERPGIALAAHFSAGGEGTAGGRRLVRCLHAARRAAWASSSATSPGRGVAAAARMGQLRSVARAYAVEGHAPVDVVARLNLYHQALRAGRHDDADLLPSSSPIAGACGWSTRAIRRRRWSSPARSARLLEGSCPALGHRRDLPRHRRSSSTSRRRDARALHRRPHRAPPRGHRRRAWDDC